MCICMIYCISAPQLSRAVDYTHTHTHTFMYATHILIHTIYCSSAPCALKPKPSTVNANPYSLNLTP